MSITDNLLSGIAHALNHDETGANSGATATQAVATPMATQPVATPLVGFAAPAVQAVQPTTQVTQPVYAPAAPAYASAISAQPAPAFAPVPTENFLPQAASAPTPAQSGIPLTATLDLARLLLDQIRNHCSDLHLSATKQPYWRDNHGQVSFLNESPATSPEDLKTVFSALLGVENFKKFIETNEYDGAQEIPGIGRFRLNLFRDVHGIGAVFRQIPADLPTVESVELPRSIVDLICTAKDGLVLVTGQNESGKTTTVNALVNHINETRAAHILMLEDPIEFLHTRKRSAITQREIGKHCRSYSEAMRHALRQDVDVIVIGEMRDLDTIRAATELAEAGYLVLGTLHTRNALESIERIVEVFPIDSQQLIRIQLSLNLKCIISQKLIPKKDGNGRVVCREIVNPDDGIRHVIRQGKTEQLYAAMETNQMPGNILFDKYLKALAEHDLIDLELAKIESHFPNNF